MRVLITGGAGRLGVEVCKTFIKSGLHVRVMDLDNPTNRKSINALNGKVETIWGDVTQYSCVTEALDGVDAVVHMAGILPPVAYERPQLAEKVNVGGTRILVDAIKEKGGHIPFVFTSSVAAFGPTPSATKPLCTEMNMCVPKGAYGETKLEAEELIRESGIAFVILRLTATMYLSFGIRDVKRMFTIPLNNRIEYCHPHDTAVAILNAINHFEQVRGDTLVVSGGPKQRMLYREMLGAILGVMGLPLPPDRKFTKEPYYLDWYDTSRSQALLGFQQRGFADYLKDYARELAKRYGPGFIPFMRYFISPVLGKVIVQFF